MLIYAFLLVIMMIFRPAGILGSKEITVKGIKKSLQKLFSKKISKSETKVGA